MSETKTHWKKMTNPNFIGAYDFDKGEHRVLTIKEVVNDDVMNGDGKTEECVVLNFTTGKPMILNKTNLKAIELSLRSAFIEDWVGKQISVHVEQVKAFGAIHDALRISTKSVSTAKPKPVALPTLTEKHENWEKVTGYVASNKDDFDTVMKSISGKYKVSPGVKKQLKTIHDGE